MTLATREEYLATAASAGERYEREIAPRVRSRIVARPEEQRPPAPWTTFYVALHCPGRNRHQRSLAGLSDEELAWVARSVLAEVEQRRKVNDAPANA